jgi:3-isopropylmalate/(R)-2-methylmalate dehydratase large subunit
MPERTFATIDHIIPTAGQQRPFADELAEDMTVHLVRNTQASGVAFFDLDSGRQGIVHVIGPDHPWRRRGHRVRDRDDPGP